jgi:hypothetical protein
VLKNIRHIVLLFVLLMGVLSNGFANSFEHDASKIRVEKGAERQKGIKAWEKAIDFPNVRKDVDFLTAFSKAIDDPILKNAAINIETRFKDWITESHLKCRTCVTGSEPFLNDVLNNLYNFKDFLSKPGAIDVVNDLTGSTKDAIGANWLMKFTKDRGINPFVEVL